MPWDPRQHSNLRQLLIQQFMLHEIQHHELHHHEPNADTAGEAEPLLPIAHGLIDIYKCLHQGEYGVGHTIDEPDGFKKRLFQEIMRDQTLEPVREPAVEAVSTDGRRLRINLRALKKFYIDDVAGTVEELARICIESARLTRGDNARFFETLDLFRMLNKAGEIAMAGYIFVFPEKLVDTFFFEVRQLMRKIRQVPVLSHSGSYRQLNRPSYRVVERSVLKDSMLGDLLESKEKFQ